MTRTFLRDGVEEVDLKAGFRGAGGGAGAVDWSFEKMGG